MGLLSADMFFALLASAILLVYLMIVRYITNDILINREITEAIRVIVQLMPAMLGLAAIEYISNYFIAYQGHITGARMKYDMCNDLFEHYQRLSFNFYDNQK